MNTSFYTPAELERMGFRTVGEHVKVSRFSQFYGIENISIGNNVRIDDFCILSGNIVIKNNIHISAYCALYGGGAIIMDDYSGLSPRCTLLSATDDFSGEFLIGPQNIEPNINILKGEIKLNKFCQLGAGTIVFPKVSIGEGSVVGSMSLVNKDVSDWGVYVGVPVKRIKDRSKNLLHLLNE